MAAYPALSIVLREHAGFLKSYESDYRASIYKCAQILDDCVDDEEMVCGNVGMVWLLRRIAAERIHSLAPELMPVNWNVDKYRWYPVTRYIRSLHEQQVHVMMAPIRQAILDQPVFLFEL